MLILRRIWKEYRIWSEGPDYKELNEEGLNKDQINKDGIKME